MVFNPKFCRKGITRPHKPVQNRKCKQGGINDVVGTYVVEEPVAVWFQRVDPGIPGFPAVEGGGDISPCGIL